MTAHDARVNTLQTRLDAALEGEASSVKDAAESDVRASKMEARLDSALEGEAASGKSAARAVALSAQLRAESQVSNPCPETLQGNLAHKKTHIPPGSPLDPPRILVTGRR